MIRKNNCKNFNHGRILVYVQYCVECGERFNVQTDLSGCTDIQHQERTKQKLNFCCDCGVRLMRDRDTKF